MRRCVECGHPVEYHDGGWIHVNLEAWATNPHPALPQLEESEDPE